MSTLPQKRSHVNRGLQRLLHNSQADPHFSGRTGPWGTFALRSTRPPPPPLTTTGLNIHWTPAACAVLLCHGPAQEHYLCLLKQRRSDWGLGTDLYATLWTPHPLATGTAPERGWGGPIMSPHEVRILQENNQVKTSFAAHFQGSENPQRCPFTKALPQAPLFQLTTTILGGRAFPPSK